MFILAIKCKTCQQIISYLLLFVCVSIEKLISTRWKIVLFTLVIFWMCMLSNYWSSENNLCTHLLLCADELIKYLEQGSFIEWYIVYIIINWLVIKINCLLLTMFILAIKCKTCQKIISYLLLFVCVSIGEGTASVALC
jgi:hypothetical protein